CARSPASTSRTSAPTATQRPGAHCRRWPAPPAETSTGGSRPRNHSLRGAHVPATTEIEPPALDPSTLRVIPLGGVGEIGRNMTVYELDGKLLIVDVGVLFPEEHQPGVDLILPDIGPIRDR